MLHRAQKLENITLNWGHIHFFTYIISLIFFTASKIPVLRCTQQRELISNSTWAFIFSNQCHKHFWVCTFITRTFEWGKALQTEHVITKVELPINPTDTLKYLDREWQYCHWIHVRKACYILMLWVKGFQHAQNTIATRHSFRWLEKSATRDRI